MSAIHYKFSSSNEYKNVTFDGLNLSLHDLKKLIMEKQKLKSTELDLHITNAQTLQGINHIDAFYVLYHFFLTMWETSFFLYRPL